MALNVAATLMSPEHPERARLIDLVLDRLADPPEPSGTHPRSAMPEGRRVRAVREGYGQLAWKFVQSADDLRDRPELAAALMFAAMFGAFVIQVVTRYVLHDPAGWTSELATLAYVWIVFFAAAFILGEREHIAFDMLYHAAPPAGR